jgi:hypothetical protein
MGTHDPPGGFDTPFPPPPQGTTTVPCPFAAEPTEAERRAFLAGQPARDRAIIAAGVALFGSKLTLLEMRRNARRNLREMFASVYHVTAPVPAFPFAAARNVRRAPRRARVRVTRGSPNGATSPGSSHSGSRRGRWSAA